MTAPKEVLDQFDPDWDCGYSAPQGWEDLVVECHRAIVAICPDYKINQIKEKFRGLRYYVSLPDGITKETSDQVYDLIRSAEAKAWKTCAVCGKEMTPIGDGFGMPGTCNDH